MTGNAAERSWRARLWCAVAVMLIGALAIAPSALAAPTATLVKDIRPGAKHSEPNWFTQRLGKVYFGAHDGPAHARELWTSDGTRAGTHLVKDINPGAAGSGLANLTNIAGTLYFRAIDATHGSELWKSDGTRAGTRLVKDINPGSAGGIIPVFYPGRKHPPFVNLAGNAYFLADDGIHGRELWRTDGTAAGTQLVKDISPGSADSSPTDLTNVAGTLFFAANGGLWRTDGTEAGTQLVRDIGAGSLTNFAGTLFFTGFDETYGAELWKSDGTEAGTELVKDITPGPEPCQYADGLPCYPGGLRTFPGTPFSGTLFFGGQASGGVGFWKSDGTDAGTQLVKNTGGVFIEVTYFAGKLFLSAGGPYDVKLWTSDGTSAGTNLFGKTVRSPLWFTTVSNTLFFVAYEPSLGDKLWASNGTPAGTQRVGGLGVSQLGRYASTVVGKRLFFQGKDPSHGGELWKAVP